MPESKHRPTIGVVASDIYDDNPFALWRGITDAAREYDASLVYFSTGLQLNLIDWQARLVYALTSPDVVDGLIIIPSTLAFTLTPVLVNDFKERFAGLPIISLDDTFDGVPCILKENYRGMVDLLSHLIEVHGRRRILQIHGPTGFEGVEERSHAWNDVLVEHGLPVDRCLITPPLKSWRYEDAVESFQSFLDTSGLSPGRDFDAVSAANDESAMAALAVLQRMGIHVPEDVAVTGFDDLDMAAVTIPPLTTVRPPYYLMGKTAVRLLLARLRGESIPERSMVPPQIMVRRSCGCELPAITQVVTGNLVKPTETLNLKGLAETLANQHELITQEIARVVDSMPAANLWAGQLLNGFLDEIGLGVRRAFLTSLDGVLIQAALDGASLEEWQNAISVLRRSALQYLSDGNALRTVEDLCQKGRVMVGEMAWRAHARRRLVSVERERELRILGTVLTTHLNLEELLKTLAEELPRRGISRCYLSIFENPHQPLAKARLLLGYDEGGIINVPAEECAFSSSQLMPPRAWPPELPFYFMVEVLSFRDEPLGFILFETNRPVGRTTGRLFDALKVQISNSIKAAMLHLEVQHARQEAEAGWQLAEERREVAEQANRLKSVFLSMVSHELRTPLNVIAGLSENLTQEKVADENYLPEPVRRDIERIHVSAQHLDGLIRDVLDLASSQVGQLKLVNETLEIADVLKPVIAMGERLAREKGLEWRSDIPISLPPIVFDRTRLRQVLLNLINNAVKFTRQGEIILKVENQDDKVMFSVSDTGLGIPLAEQEMIFEEFRRSERSTARGYGGMGLGLAICRRLVELGGGQISVDSSGEEGAGSRFYFTLPAGKEPKPVIDHHRSEEVVLLTSRSADAAVLIRRLEKSGFEVEVLQVDEENLWLQMVLDSPPGAIILDYEPAAEQGWEIISALKNNPLAKDVPVIFYSLIEEDNTGTIFDLDYLAKPVARAALAEALARQGLSHEKTSSKTILIVEDEATVLDLHTRMLQEQLPGCQVIQARDGRQALNLMHEVPPNLVLLDLMMPEMDGFSVLEHMREIESIRSVPVIVLTSQKLSELEMQRLNQGVAAVLGKGLFSIEETLALIEESLERNNRLGGEARRISRQAMGFIHEHYPETISRKELAAYLGVSQEYLSTCFHREVGVPLVNYIERYRIRKARELLETTDKSITEVAQDIGFTDSSYFGRVFRREVGVSPMAYRRGEQHR